MIDHTSGAFNDKIGSKDAVHTFRTTYAEVTAVARKLGTILVNTGVPMFYRVTVVIEAIYAGSAAMALSVGTTSGGTEIISGVDVKVAAPTNYAATNPIRVATANTDIWLKRVDAGTSTAGSAFIIVEQWEAVPNTTS